MHHSRNSEVGGRRRRDRYRQRDRLTNRASIIKAWDSNDGITRHANCDRSDNKLADGFCDAAYSKRTVPPVKNHEERSGIEQCRQRRRERWATIPQWANEEKVKCNV